jgi:uncharacterized protein
MSDPLFSRPFTSLATASARWPRLTLVLALLLLAGSFLALQRLRISSSLDAMFGIDSPSAQALHHAATQYRAGDALLVIAEIPHPSQQPPGPAGADPLIGFAQRISQGLAPRHDQVAWVRYGEDPAYAAYLRDIILPSALYYLGPDAATEFARRLSPQRLREQFARNETLIAAPGPTAESLSQAFLRDPLRLAELVPPTQTQAARIDLLSLQAPQPAAPELSRDGNALLIRIGSTAPLSDIDAAVRLTALVEDAIAAANTGGLDVRIGGPFAIASASSRTIRADAIRGTLLSIALVYLLFVLLQRRWIAPLLIGITAAIGVTVGFAIPALAAPTVSPLAAAVAALLAGLGVDYGIHFHAHFEQLRAAGCPLHHSIRETARRMALPISTSCITCIFGFAALWPSGVQMLADFARLGAAGLLGALLAAFTLLPALLVLIDPFARPTRPPTPRGAFVADFIIPRPRPWLFAAIAILLAALAAAGSQGFIPRLQSDLTVLHPRPNPALETTAHITTRFGSHAEVLPVLILAPSPDALISTAIDVARSLTSKDCRSAGVVDVIGLHQLLPDPRHAEDVRRTLANIDPHRALADFDEALEDSAFEPSAYSDYRQILSHLMSPHSPPNLNDLLAHPSIATHVLPATASVQPPAETLLLVRLAMPLRDRQVRGRVVQAISSALHEHPGAVLAALPAVAESVEQATRASLVESAAISMALIMLWLALVFRRLPDVIGALTPLAFAALFAITFMVVTRLQFNPINIVAIPLLGGIAVDSGIFLVSAARRGGAAPESLMRELRPTVHAVILAAATTITAFASLLIMHTPAIRSLGAIAIAGLAASLIGALALLLPLLIIASRRGPTAPCTSPEAAASTPGAASAAPPLTASPAPQPHHRA